MFLYIALVFYTLHFLDFWYPWAIIREQYSRLLYGTVNNALWYALTDINWWTLINNLPTLPLLHLNPINHYHYWYHWSKSYLDKQDAAIWQYHCTYLDRKLCEMKSCLTGKFVLPLVFTWQWTFPYLTRSRSFFITNILTNFLLNSLIFLIEDSKTNFLSNNINFLPNSHCRISAYGALYGWDRNVWRQHMSWGTDGNESIRGTYVSKPVTVSISIYLFLFIAVYVTISISLCLCLCLSVSACTAWYSLVQHNVR